MTKVDIFKDIAGRASEVLSALGIDQHALQKHVHCPLPCHDDQDPSFRVDRKTERFFCTCTPKGASMVDLVIAMGYASDFIEATRWLRREMNIQFAGAHPIRVAANFVPPPAPDKARAKAREEILRVLARCIAVPPMHPYTTKKGILPVGARYEPTLKCLVLPIHDADYELQGLELIHPDGSKSCVDGSKKSGNGLILGDPSRSPVLAVTEGWATGVSVHSALSGLPVLVTFGCTNLGAVSKFLRPGQQAWLFADNDPRGLDAAHAVSRTLTPAGLVLVPTLGDFNDDFVAGIGPTTFTQHRRALNMLLGRS
jgi:putative DNA primase/helicase